MTDHTPDNPESLSQVTLIIIGLEDLMKTVVADFNVDDYCAMIEARLAEFQAGVTDFSTFTALLAPDFNLVLSDEMVKRLQALTRESTDLEVTDYRYYLQQMTTITTRSMQPIVMKIMTSQRYHQTMEKVLETIGVDRMGAMMAEMMPEEIRDEMRELFESEDDEDEDDLP